MMRIFLSLAIIGALTSCGTRAANPWEHNSTDPGSNTAADPSLTQADTQKSATEATVRVWVDFNAERRSLSVTAGRSQMREPNQSRPESVEVPAGSFQVEGRVLEKLPCLFVETPCPVISYGTVFEDFNPNTPDDIQVHFSYKDGANTLQKVINLNRVSLTPLTFTNIRQDGIETTWHGKPLEGNELLSLIIVKNQRGDTAGDFCCDSLWMRGDTLLVSPWSLRFLEGSGLMGLAAQRKTDTKDEENGLTVEVVTTYLSDSVPVSL